MRLLDRFYDPALEVDSSITPVYLIEENCRRVTTALAVVETAGAIPRRLSQASYVELALDKKRARRVAHALRQSLAGWRGTPRAATAEEAQLGAQLNWQQWWEQHEVDALYCLRYAATWAKKCGYPREGKSAVVRIEQELDWLRYALRD